MATHEEVLASVKRGKPPVDCSVIGTWSLRSYVRERLSDGQRHNQFGEAPVGYIGYAPDGRMYAIFTRDDRVAPRDVVPTDEEGVQLLGTMVAYAGTFSLGENVVVHHIDTSWNQAWTRLVGAGAADTYPARTAGSTGESDCDASPCLFSRRLRRRPIAIGRRGEVGRR